ncbi:MAG: hypothetical protein C0412_21685 [Flavobacterium sp.]|nr:hypothetical protein [Flavobacterium sp.]
MKVLEEFQQLFDSVTLPFIERLGIEDNFSEPLFYTLRQKSNKFRSATALISAKMCGGNYNDVLPIVATSEIVHSSIIIQDDIADDDSVRRGKEAAWRKYGTCSALYASLYVMPECLRLLAQLQSPQAATINQLFWESYQDVCKSQIRQVRLRLSEDIPYTNFLAVHLGKTALGRWAITAPAVLYGNEAYAKIFNEFAIKLGDAGSLKNDTEDFLQDDDYEPFCTDIRIGNLTYPIFYYFSQCAPIEQEEFLLVFGKNKTVDYSEIGRKIIDKGTIPHCIKKYSD